MSKSIRCLAAGYKTCRAPYFRLFHLTWLGLALLPGWAVAACGYLPSTYPIYGASNLQLDDYVKVNGNYLNPVDFNGGSRDAVETDGDVVAATLALPDLDPVSFPVNASSTDRTNPSTLAAGSYRTVTINTGSQLLSGGTYYIKTLTITRPKGASASTLTLNSGDYFIETLTLNSSNVLKVSGTARVFIKTKFDAKGNSQSNFGGAVNGLQVFLYGSATFTASNNAKFTGVIMGPGASRITASTKSTLKGAFLTAGNIVTSANRSSRTINVTYGAPEQAAVSTVSTCTTTPIVALARWNLDETSWGGTSNEVEDTSGNAYHGTGKNSVTTESVSPAIAGSPGTCRYGQFDGVDDYLEVAGLPNLSSSFTVTAWIKPASLGSPQRILVDDQNDTNGWGFSLGDDLANPGRLRLYSRTVSPVFLDSTYDLTAGNWYFVAASADLTNKVRALHVFNSAGTLLNTTTEAAPYTGTWGTDASAASIGGETNAAAENYHFNGSLDEIGVYQGVLNSSQIAGILAEKRSCVAVSVPGAFNVFDTDTEADSIEGVIKTKVAAQTFALDVVALNADGDDVDTGFTGAVTVQLLDSSNNSGTLDAGSCRSSWSTLSSLGSYTFVAGDSGRKLISGISLANSYRDLRVKVTHTASGNSGCSTDNFAMRPNNLAGTGGSGNAIAATDADWQTAGTARTLANTGASGGNLHKAGRDFSLSAQAYTASGTTASNYNGTPSLAVVSCTLPASGCVTGTASASGWSNSSGVLSTSAASYSEVGVISAKLSDASYAAVDASDGSSTAELTVESAAFSMGRFVPDHFDVTANTPAFTPACGSFTYLGQPFGLGTAPVWTVTARNQGGGTTQNYTGSLFKLSTASITGQTWSDAAHTVAAVGSLPSISVADTGGGTGSLTFSVGNPDPAVGGGLVYSRSTLTSAFDATLDLAANVIDSESVSYTGNPFQHTGIGFDDANAGTTTDAQMRFGRLRIANATGSEFLALPISLTAQYWNGSGYVTNTADACTALAAPTLTYFTPPTTPNNQLESGETTATYNNPFLAGLGGLRLTAPGNGNFGYLDVTMTAPAWLQYNWDGVDQYSDGNLFDDNPRSRAAFGKRKGRDKVIIRREIY
jgi:hypothetical protein